jgi:hypothetical protein
VTALRKKCADEVLFVVLEIGLVLFPNSTDVILGIMKFLPQGEKSPLF